MSQGLLIVVSAPSGAGKTSLVRAALERDAALEVSVSHTTRPIRPGERDGVNYHFVAHERFQEMIGEGAFVEHAEVFGRCYGTSKTALATALEAGRDVVLEIDWQGAEQLRQAFGSAQVSVFILPPSVAVLEERLRNRGQDDEATIRGRMQKAKSEMSHYHEYDYLLINDDFETAVRELLHVISAERLSLARQRARHSSLIEDLLS